MYSVSHVGYDLVPYDLVVLFTPREQVADRAKVAVSISFGLPCSSGIVEGTWSAKEEWLAGTESKSSAE